MPLMRQRRDDGRDEPDEHRISHEAYTGVRRHELPPDAGNADRHLRDIHRKQRVGEHLGPFLGNEQA